MISNEKIAHDLALIYAEHQMNKQNVELDGCTVDTSTSELLHIYQDAFSEILSELS